MIKKQVARMEAIVSQYLESARAQAPSVHHVALDLNGVLSETILLLAPSASEGCRIHGELSSEALPVLGDPTQLSQAFYNLVLNALQAVAGLRQSTQGRRMGRIEVRSGRAGGEGEKAGIFVEVADDGPGVPATVLDRLFEPFLTTKKGGVGLGLSIVKRIAQAHGGELEVESPRQDLGYGARFRLLLPPCPPLPRG
jgi:signal transduction histidine kinase